MASRDCFVGTIDHKVVGLTSNHQMHSRRLSRPRGPVLSVIGSNAGRRVGVRGTVRVGDVRLRAAVGLRCSVWVVVPSSQWIELADA